VQLCRQGRSRPRRCGADIAIGVTAASLGAHLLTRNARDFAGIPESPDQQGYLWPD